MLQILEQENLIQNAQEMGDYLVEQVKDLPKVKEVRSVGLMTGIELEMPCAEVRNNLLWKHKILTGNASNKNTLRILPSLAVSKAEIDQFVNALKLNSMAKLQKFTCVDDVPNLEQALQECIDIKNNPLGTPDFGKTKL